MIVYNPAIDFKRKWLVRKLVKQGANYVEWGYSRGEQTVEGFKISENFMLDKIKPVSRSSWKWLPCGWLAYVTNTPGEQFVRELLRIYPTMEQVYNANKIQLALWCACLPNPSPIPSYFAREVNTLNLIIVRFNKLGGWNPELRRKIKRFHNLVRR